MLMINEAIKMYIDKHLQQYKLIDIDSMSSEAVSFIYSQIRFKKEFEDIVNSNFPELKQIINIIRQEAERNTKNERK